MNSFLVRSCMTAVAAIVMLAGVQVQAQQNVLRWKLDEGQKFKIETSQNQTQAMNVGGQDVQMKINQDINMNWNVKAVDGDKFTIGMQVTRIKMNMESPMGGMEFDSENPDAGGGGMMDLGGMLKPMLDAEITFVMDARGNISDVKVPEDLKEKMAGAGGGMGGMGAPGPEMLEQMAKMSMVVFPEEPVTGDSEWEHSVSQKNMVEMTIDSKYKYAGQEDVAGEKLHKINVNSDIQLKTEEMPNGGTVELDSAESKGTVFFDNAAGIMKKATSEQKMVMFVSVQGQEIEMEGNVKSEVKMTPVKD